MAIFVSYSQKDKDFVDTLCSNLLSEKIHFWIDRWELKPGDSLIDSVQLALSNAGAVLMVLSNNYLNSNWCTKELNASLIKELEGSGNVIIPVVIEKCEIPLFLKEKLYVDFTKGIDENFAYLAESLAKYTNLDQGRLDKPEYFVDYSSEYVTTNKGRVIGIRYQFVEHAQNRPYTILSIINIYFSDIMQNKYQKYIDNNLESVGRALISNILIDYFENNKIEIKIKDANVIQNEIIINDKKYGELGTIISEVRWMGNDTGKTIIYWLGESVMGALRDFLSKITPPSGKARF